MSQHIKFGPHNLSELVSTTTGEEKTSFYGVVVDKFCPNVIKGVDRISFVAALDSPDELSFDVIDVLIQYQQHKADVLLEVPFDFPLPAREVIVLTYSINVGIIITPPAEKTEENWKVWAEQVKAYSKALFEVEGFAGEILPVTSYVQYMAMEVMGYKPTGLTDDEMMNAYFEKQMDIPVMDALKEEMHEIILEGNGGKDSFESLVQSTLSALNDSVVDEGKNRLKLIAQLSSNPDTEQRDSFIKQLLHELGHAEVSEKLAPLLSAAFWESTSEDEFVSKACGVSDDPEDLRAIYEFVALAREGLNDPSLRGVAEQGDPVESI